MRVDPNSPHTRLTKRQQEVLDRLEAGMAVKQIATDIGVSRNAVYGHIERLRRQGALGASYTPSGQPPRRIDPGGARPTAVGTPGASLGPLRELALAETDRGGPEYGRAIESAIAAGDAVALAYELGRLDAAGEGGLPGDLVESALRRLGALPDLDAASE